jgi:hypothetical protein
MLSSEISTVEFFFFVSKLSIKKGMDGVDEHWTSSRVILTGEDICSPSYMYKVSTVDCHVNICWRICETHMISFFLVEFFFVYNNHGLNMSPFILKVQVPTT